MVTNSGVGFGQNGEVRVLPGGNAGLQPEREAFDRLVGCLMRGIALTRGRPANGDMLLAVKGLHECGSKAYCDNDQESLDHAYEALKSIRLY